MGKSRSEKNKARKARLADAERRREAHTRLVVERSGNAQFVQRQIDPLTGDRTLSMSPQHPAAQDMRESMQELRREFTERFGREPGPEDPLFFDPVNDVPTEMPPEAAATQFDTMLDNMAAQTDDPTLQAQLRAAKDVGFILTESNMHLFSAHDIDAWEDALDRHLDH
ncbi:hypothetical protein ACIBM3_31255 [Rhodococcus erythropolis]|uniref:hypothetical protein n=1 Tax=Rhodococcus erythropolis TaxID=1833 RepID=UPI0037B6A0E5